MPHKILIGSPIHQKPAILKQFLYSLSRLVKKDMDIHYLFIDDNVIDETSQILTTFCEERQATIIKSKTNDAYMTDEDTHYWNNHLVWKVADFKNQIIDYAKKQHFDYLFFVDSDLILHPHTLEQLRLANKDIIANIFWTKWHTSLPPLPQVWMFNEYEQYHYQNGEIVTTEEKEKRQQEFLTMLREPGIYPVGGLGACTLLSRHALNKGVNFNEIKNISFWGEDRHFCVRAQALGLDLFVDTHYPSLHLYRDTDISATQQYLHKTQITEPIHNEKAIIMTIKKGLTTYLNPAKQPVEWESFFTNHFIPESSKNSHDGDLSIYDIQFNQLDPVLNVAVVSFLLVQKFSESDKPFKQKFDCKAHLIKDEESWLINRFSQQKQIPRQKTEQINEEKKILTIINTNYSGSNAVALYRLLPENIREMFHIHFCEHTADNSFFKKVMNSHIVITTEGNYPFHKQVLNHQQHVIELWHGFPLKAMGYMDKTDHHVKRIGETWSNIDYITSYSDLFNQKMNQCIQTDIDKYMITGVPRNDLLLQDHSRQKLASLLNMDITGKKCLFYLPTYRFSPMKQLNEGDKQADNLFGLSTFDQDTFKQFLAANNIILIAKPHPVERWTTKKRQTPDYIHFLTNDMLKKQQLDLYDILGAADLLLTDYSSVYFDYLLLDRPVIFIPTDLQTYQKRRGLLFDYQQMTPGPKVMNQQKLQEEITHSLSRHNYFKRERHMIRDMIHFYQDNQSAKRVWNLIRDL